MITTSFHKIKRKITTRFAPRGNLILLVLIYFFEYGQSTLAVRRLPGIILLA